MQKDRFKTRKQKLNYLGGLISGNNSLEEIASFHAHFFVQTIEPGIYYSCEPLDGKYTPVPINGKLERLTQADIDKMKRPNCFCITMDLSPMEERPPFPKFDENGLWINAPTP